MTNKKLFAPTRAKINPEEFLTDLENDKPFIKAAFQGFAGSGKTYTAAHLAMHIHKKIGSTKPIYAYDTEKAIRALKPFFDAEGIQVKIRRTRSIVDLEYLMDLCHQGHSDILIIDSLTHVWESFMNDYMRQMNRTQLYFQDWGIVKPYWKEHFSDKMVNANCHIIFTGRAGYTYDEEINERGMKEITKSGVKMKAETETAFEPDLLVQMDLHQNLMSDTKRVWRTATILKDRTTLIDGKVFENPKASDFDPFVEHMLDGTLKNDEQIPGHVDFRKMNEGQQSDKREREILLEKIGGIFDEMQLGTAKNEKALKIKLFSAFLGTSSKTELETFGVGQLTGSHIMLEQFKIKYFELLKSAGDEQRGVTESEIDEVIRSVKEEFEFINEEINI